MSDIVNLVKERNMFRSAEPANEKQVRCAETALGVTFSDEYREYLRAFGVASYEGHELTGISEFSRLSVVDATEEAREIYATMDSRMYVIEDTGYEGLLILQNQKGEIYQIEPQRKPEKIHPSLSAYVQES